MACELPLDAHRVVYRTHYDAQMRIDNHLCAFAHRSNEARKWANGPYSWHDGVTHSGEQSGGVDEEPPLECQRTSAWLTTQMAPQHLLIQPVAEGGVEWYTIRKAI